MGCCCSNKLNTDIVYLVLKLPHSKEYILYSKLDKKFIKYNNINDWLTNLYKNNKWTKWIIYNDQGHEFSKTSKGHTKGILTWNNNKIAWLCHSVPKYPKYFSNTGISKIDDSELMYGQSFQYIEINFNNDILNDIITQLKIMQVNVYIKKCKIPINKIKTININKIKITDNIYHVAKSPNYKIDIYSKYLINEYNYNWKIETWIRGHEINNSINIIDIKKLKFENILYDENQDHSKWGVSDNDYYLIGGLNRMTTQIKRGGDIFICKDKNICLELNKLIIE
jgi:hypothetical protein